MPSRFVIAGLYPTNPTSTDSYPMLRRMKRSNTTSPACAFKSWSPRTRTAIGPSRGPKVPMNLKLMSGGTGVGVGAGGGRGIQLLARDEGHVSRGYLLLVPRAGARAKRRRPLFLRVRRGGRAGNARGGRPRGPARSLPAPLDDRKDQDGGQRGQDVQLPARGRRRGLHRTVPPTSAAREISPSSPEKYVTSETCACTVPGTVSSRLKPMSRTAIHFRFV